MFEKLLQEIRKAKNDRYTTTKELYYLYGRVCLAYELMAITVSEYMQLNHEVVYNGINNPKYFTEYVLKNKQQRTPGISRRNALGNRTFQGVNNSIGGNTMKKAKKTAIINIRATPEMKAFIEYLAEKYVIDNTEVIETAIKDHYNRQYGTFKSTVYEEDENDI